MDRNFYYADKDADWVRSLSARRAWIEMQGADIGHKMISVALRKESVDRNKIRITPIDSVSVALRKESVDRNTS